MLFVTSTSLHFSSYLLLSYNQSVYVCCFFLFYQGVPFHLALVSLHPSSLTPSFCISPPSCLTAFTLAVLIFHSVPTPYSLSAPIPPLHSIHWRLPAFPASSLSSCPYLPLLSPTHPVLSPHLPPSAVTVNYSDSDIITLVVTGFICTLWTYTSAWVIVRGPGPAMPRPHRDRLTDRLVLNPLGTAGYFFSSLFQMCHPRFKTPPCLKKHQSWTKKKKKYNSREKKTWLACDSWKALCRKLMSPQHWEWKHKRSH